MTIMIMYVQMCTWYIYIYKHMHMDATWRASFVTLLLNEWASSAWKASCRNLLLKDMGLVVCHLFNKHVCIFWHKTWECGYHKHNSRKKQNWPYSDLVHYPKLLGIASTPVGARMSSSCADNAAVGKGSWLESMHREANMTQHYLAAPAPPRKH